MTNLDEIPAHIRAHMERAEWLRGAASVRADEARLHPPQSDEHRRQQAIAAELERRAQVAGKVGQPAPVSEAKGGRGNEGGIRKAARELDMKRDAVRRAVKVAALSPEAKAAAREVGLDDNRAAMLKAAEKPPAKQAATIREIARTKATTPAPKKSAEMPPERAALIAAWKAATKKDRRWFLLWVQNEARS